MPHKPLEGMALILMTLGVSLGTFIQILDTSIANVSIPTIAGDLGASPNQGTWVITSFAVSNAIVLPLTGWIANRFGDVRVFVISTLLFSLMSWLCGIAWSLPVLIGFRILQGAVAGSLIPLSQSLLIQNYAPEMKGLALGFWSMVVILAPILGPILGGWITDEYTWPWIFYINVPIGLISALLTWRILKDRESPTEQLPVDYIGFALLIIGVGCLQVTLDKGQELDWFGSDAIRSLAVCAALGIAFFIAWDLFTPNAVVDMSFFRERNFAMGTFLASVVFLLFFGSLVLLPLWLQTKMGYTPFWAGITVMPIGIFPLLLSSTIGKNINRWDPRLLGTISFFVLGVTYFWLSNFTTDVSLQHIVMVRFFQGFGLAFFFIPLLTIALSEVPNHRITSASGVFNFCRLIAGGGFGTALFVTLWQRREIFHHSRLVEAVTPFSENTREVLDILKLQGIEGMHAKAVLETVVAPQASVLSMDDTFILCGWIHLLLIPLLWVCHRPRVGEGHLATGE